MLALDRPQINTVAYWDERYRTEVDEMWKIWTTGDLIEKIAAHVPQGASVLDVGCGAGIVPTRINAIRPDIRWSGCDFSPEAIAYCKRLPLRWESLFVHNALTGIDAPWTWDIVVSTEVLEHVDRPTLAIRTMVSAALDLVIVSVPNRNAINSREHIWSYSSESLIKLLGPYGLTTVEPARQGRNLIASCRLIR